MPSAGEFEPPTAAENAAHDSYEMKTFEGGKTTNQAGYDDFASLRSRLAARVRSSVGDSEGPITTAADAADDNTLVGGKRINQAGYDNFASLRSRLAVQIQGSVGDSGGPIAAAAVTADDATERENGAHNTVQVDLHVREEEDRV